MQAVIRVDPRAGMYVSAETDDDGAAREALRRRFRDRLIVRQHLNRRLVSYQANKEQPGLRWFKYKEGFSAELVRAALRTGAGPVLDPFAGIGTTALVAAGARREEVPVDLILADIAERCGFRCEEISVLPRGKGNASQQMGRYGRRELRKCVYRWRRYGNNG